MDKTIHSFVKTNPVQILLPVPSSVAAQEAGRGAKIVKLKLVDGEVIVEQTTRS